MEKKSIRALFESIPQEQQLTWKDYLYLLEDDPNTIDRVRSQADQPAPVAQQTGHDIWGQPAPQEGHQTLAGRLFRAPVDTFDDILGKPHPSLAPRNPAPVAVPQNPTPSNAGPSEPPFRVPPVPPQQNYMRVPDVPHYDRNMKRARLPPPPPIPDRQPTMPGPLPKGANAAYIRQYFNTMRGR